MYFDVDFENTTSAIIKLRLPINVNYRGRNDDEYYIRE